MSKMLRNVILILMLGLALTVEVTPSHAQAISVNIKVVPTYGNVTIGQHIGFFVTVDKGGFANPLSGYACIRWADGAKYNYDPVACHKVPANGVIAIDDFPFEKLCCVPDGSGRGWVKITAMYWGDPVYLPNQTSYEQYVKPYAAKFTWFPSVSHITLGQKASLALVVENTSPLSLKKPRGTAALYETDQTGTQKIKSVGFASAECSLDCVADPKYGANGNFKVNSLHYDVSNLTLGWHYFRAEWEGLYVIPSPIKESDIWWDSPVVAVEVTSPNFTLELPQAPAPQFPIPPSNSAVTPQNNDCTPGKVIGRSSSGSPITSTCDNRAAQTGPMYVDGRLNNSDGNENVAVYCNKGGDVKIIAIDNAKGTFDMIVRAQEIAKLPQQPATNLLIKEHKGLRLYRLTDGQLQVNRAYPDGQSDYVFRFDCHPQ